MPFGFFGPYFLILIPPMLLAMYAQHKVRSTYTRYSTVPNKTGISGREAAERILQSRGFTDVTIEQGQGELTDYYDPRKKLMKLSEGVYSSKSISAVSIAAHESGHVIQHMEGYALLKFRNAIAVPVSLVSNLAMPLFIIGMFIGVGGGSGQVGMIMMMLGIAFFSAVVLFHLITLPVEIDASRRAVKQLEILGIIMPGEKSGAKKVLNAAAMTYLAALAVALANLIRLVLIVAARRE